MVLQDASLLSGFRAEVTRRGTADRARFVDRGDTVTLTRRPAAARSELRDARGRGKLGERQAGARDPQR